MSTAAPSTLLRWTVRRADRTPTLRAGQHWTRLGPDVVLWQGATRDAPSLPGPVRTCAGLALVTQVGRAFQDAHPDVPVLLDHGRHLVVEAAELPPGNDHCWRAVPLPQDQVVVGDAPGPRRRLDARGTAVVAALSEQAYEADVRWLAGLPTRHSLSASFDAAAGQVAARLTALGFAVSRPSISVGAGSSSNVVGTLAGTGGGSAVVVVTAHLDSVNLAGGPAAPAPGADDNASGVAGVLELARVLAGRSWVADLQCILFGGEEQGLHGSRQHVAQLSPSERARTSAVVNMDMIAVRNGAGRSVLLEGAPLSTEQIAVLADAAATHTGLSVQTSLQPFASDHVPFLEAGMPAVLTIEGNDRVNTAIHSAADTLDRLDLDLALEVLRMNAAAAAHWLSASAVPRPAGPVVSWGPGRLDVFHTGPDSGLGHRWWDGAAWQPAAGVEDLGRTPRPP